MWVYMWEKFLVSRWPKAHALKILIILFLFHYTKANCVNVDLIKVSYLLVDWQKQ